jgi:hypothetical protein
MENQLHRIETTLHRFEEKVNAFMSKTDDGIALIQSTLNKFATDLQAEFTALKNEIANGVDTAPRLAAIQAIVAQVQGLDASAIANTPVPVSVIAVAPGSVSLTGVGSTETIVASEAANPSASFTASSSNANVATVSPGTAPGSFVVTEVAAGTAIIEISDNASPANTVNVSVTAS